MSQIDVKKYFNKTYNYWTIISPRRINNSGRTKVLGKCKCGNIVSVNLQNVVRGLSKSCGCLLKEGKRAISTITTKVPEYNNFHHMHARCSNPKHRKYHLYGGRGIIVCIGWNDFKNFYQDLGPKPSIKHSLDRINSNGNYSCGRCEQCIENDWSMNCRWATQLTQSRNRPNFNRQFELDGKSYNSISEAAEIFNIEASTVRRRVNHYGWTIEKALKTPLIKKGNHARQSDRL